MLSCLFIAALSLPCGLVVTCLERDKLLALLRVMFSCVLSLSHMVSLVRCGICKFLIVAFSLLLSFTFTAFLLLIMSIQMFAAG